MQMQTWRNSTGLMSLLSAVLVSSDENFNVRPGLHQAVEIIQVVEMREITLMNVTCLRSIATSCWCIMAVSQKLQLMIQM